MATVLMRLRADLRTRWRGLVGLALLIGLVGGVVLPAFGLPSLASTDLGSGAVVAAPLLLANLIAAFPGRVAARLRPAIVLRTE